MNIKKLIFFIFILSITNATVYFTTPTPANNTNDFTYPIVLNISTNITNLTNPCYFEIDGVNKTGTLASDNLSCSYTVSYADTYFNHTYSVKGFANESGEMKETNETRIIPYYGCGKINASGTMLGNVSLRTTDYYCFYVLAQNIVFNCDGYSITGLGTNYGTGIYNELQNFSAYNCLITNFFDCFRLETYGGGKAENFILDNCRKGIDDFSNAKLTINNFSVTATASNTLDYTDIYNSTINGESIGNSLHIENSIFGKSNIGNVNLKNVTFFDEVSILQNNNYLDRVSIYDIQDYGFFISEQASISNSFFETNCYKGIHGPQMNMYGNVYMENTTIKCNSDPSGSFASFRMRDCSSFNATNLSFINRASYRFDCPARIYNLSLGYNETVGLVKFNEVNLTPESSSYYIGSNFVSINNGTSLANHPANITISTPDCSKTVIFKKSGFPTTYNEIIQGGSIYTPTYSSCSDNIWTFDVEGFSGYAAGYPIYFNDSYASPANGSSSTGISQNVNFTIQITTNGTNPQCNFTINGNNYLGTYNSGICSYYTSITPGLYYWNVTVAIAEGTSATSGTFLYTLNDPGGGSGGEAPPPESPSSPSETEAETPPQETPPLPPSEEITAEFIELFSATGISPTYIDTRTETIIPPSIIQATGGLIQPLIGSCPIDKSNVPAYLFGIIYCEEVTLYSLFLGKYIWLGWIFFIAMILILIAIVAIKRKDIFDWSMLGGLSINFMFGILILLINSVIITYALRGIGVETYV